MLQKQGQRLTVGWRVLRCVGALYGANGIHGLDQSAYITKAPARRGGQALALRLRRVPGRG
ncbi:hypothetical protein GCM10007315_13110 [Gemmobacter tilapiae]|uniref:Uncharacterized protein n=1 Tax=Neogemmobacter tilapiae TaxID=875041 RepID=A0A918TM40_9RHOB|nr:hypothetical protein GCM10007315_13110 [Gemmobacter tilapiae]